MTTHVQKKRSCASCASKSASAAKAPGEVWVAGYPSFVGGADTELDHMIDLWRSAGVGVHLVPFGKPDQDMQALCDLRGCRTHDYRPDIFRDRIVISFCNGAFLKKLPEIVQAGCPQTVLWANCMNWPTDAELEAHRNGWIDRHLFQSRYQQDALTKHLDPLAPVHTLEGYRPYFSLANRSQAIRRSVRPPDDYFGVGRVSRDDASKYHPQTWKALAKVAAPTPVKAFMLGFGKAASSRCGATPPCEWLDWMTWTPGAIPVGDFLSRIHVLMHVTGGSGENWPRVVLEAWAAGVVPIVDDDFGVAEMVTDGVDGFRVRSPDEATYRASQLAFDDGLRERMVHAGHQTLLVEHANTDRCLAPFRELLGSPPQNE